MAEAVVVQTSRPRQRISGVAADESGVAEVQIHGVTAQVTTASPQDLQEAGLSAWGKCVGYAELQPGTNQVEITPICMLRILATLD